MPERGQFGAVPRAIMDLEGRQIEHLGLYAALSICLPFDTGVGRVPLSRLHERTGTSPRHLKRLIADLERMGAITVERRNGRANVYRLVTINDSGQVALPGFTSNPQPRTKANGVASNGRGHSRPKPGTKATETGDRNDSTLQSFQNSQRGFEEIEQPAPPDPISITTPRFRRLLEGPNPFEGLVPVGDVIDEILEGGDA